MRHEILFDNPVSTSAFLKLEYIHEGESAIRIDVGRSSISREKPHRFIVDQIHGSVIQLFETDRFGRSELINAFGNLGIPTGKIHDTNSIIPVTPQEIINILVEQRFGPLFHQ